MAYTKEAVSETTSALPNQQQMPLREDRVVDPYTTTSRLSKAMDKVSAQNSQQNNIETNVHEETKDTAESVTLSPQMAALLRKEQRIRQKEQELKQKDTSFEAERAEIADLKALKAKLANKDYSGVEGLVDYESYTNYLLDKGANISPEQQALKKLEAKVESVEKAHQDDVSKRFEAAINERRKAVTTLVETNKEFSKIKKAGEKGREAVIQHILDTWEHDDIDLSPEQAAKEVQLALVEQAKSWAAILQEEQEEVLEDQKKSLPPLKSGIKTLTNNMAPTGEIKRPAKSFQHMTDAERYAEARRRAEEKLQAQRK